LLFRFFSGNISKTKVAQLELQSWEQQNKMKKNESNLSVKKNRTSKYQEAITYYNEFGKLSDEIIKVANSIINKVKLTSFNTFKV
jgi:cobalt-zinc-cadmium resistance protein CzcA